MTFSEVMPRPEFPALAAQQPEVKAVAVKTEAQQAVLALHRIRQGLVKMRTAQINALRGLLAEYGEVFGVGRKAFDVGMKASWGVGRGRNPASGPYEPIQLDSRHSSRDSPSCKSVGICTYAHKAWAPTVTVLRSTTMCKPAP